MNGHAARVQEQSERGREGSGETGGHGQGLWLRRGLCRPEDNRRPGRALDVGRCDVPPTGCGVWGKCFPSLGHNLIRQTGE